MDLKFQNHHIQLLVWKSSMVALDNQVGGFTFILNIEGSKPMCTTF
jgi:type IV secretory pathway VirB4 component